MLHRRNFLIGFSAALIAAPAIVRMASIMPVKAMPHIGVSQVHIQKALSAIAEAYIRDVENYALFPDVSIVPVEHQTGKYFYFSKDDFSSPHWA